MKIGDEVFVHGYIDEIRYDDTKRVSTIIIRNDGGYFGTVPSEISADRKTEPTGYNLAPVDKDINVRSKTEQENCEGCRDGDCYGCPLVKQTEPQTEDEYITELIKKKCKTEPQTDCSWK